MIESTQSSVQKPVSTCLQEFDGRWVVEPGGSGDTPVTTLRYQIALVPKLSIPSAAIVHVVRSGLPANIRAIAQRAEEARP